MNQQFGIIGNGSWATALAKMLTDNGRTINWWMRNQAAVTHLKQRHHNLHYLPSVAFAPGSTRPTDRLEEVIGNSDVLVIAVPSAYIENLLASLPPTVFRNKKIVSAVKGILPGSASLLNEYLEQTFGVLADNYIAITGPCHAEEVAQERLSYLTFSGLHAADLRPISDAFTTDYIRTTTNFDLWGTQFSAVLKNIYAVGAGIAHGFGYGDNFLSVYITNCYREMHGFLESRFRNRFPGQELPDFHTSAYLGDLLVTCYSPHSRNRTFGALLGKGYSVGSAVAEMNMVAEGYYAAKEMAEIRKRTNIDMPVMELIYEILWLQKPIFSQLQKMETLLS